MNNITGFTIKPTSNKGYSLLESNEKRGICPEISIQLPTEFAEELKRRWDKIEKIEHTELKVNERVVLKGHGHAIVNQYEVIYISPDKSTCHIERVTDGY